MSCAVRAYDELEYITETVFTAYLNCEDSEKTEEKKEKCADKAESKINNQYNNILLMVNECIKNVS